MRGRAAGIRRQIPECVRLWSFEERRGGRADIELLVSIGLFVNDVLEDLTRQWQARAKAGRAKYDLHQDLHFDAWCAAFSGVDARIQRQGRRGHWVKGADELRRRYIRATNSPTRLLVR